MRIISVRETIATYGTSAIAEAMGLPVSTIHGWKTDNAIPGKGILHEMRVQAFAKAVKALKRQAKRKKAA